VSTWDPNGIASFAGIAALQPKTYFNIVPRPKPPEPLKGRQIRLTDRHMMIFQELGGIDWLRKQLDKSAKMPAKYYRLELDAPSKKEIND
jgi:hypothetical protein